MENSFVKLLQKVGLKRPFTIPKSFQTSPNNLKRIVRILNQPAPLIDDFSKTKIIDFEEDDAQGIAYAFGSTWFLSSQNRLFKYLIVGDDLQHPQRKERIGQVALSSLMNSLKEKPPFGGDHIGDISYCSYSAYSNGAVDLNDGILFLPIRNQGQNPPHLLLGLSQQMEVVGYSILPTDISDSYCAFNPWNKMLYMPNATGQDHFISAFDVSQYFERLLNRDMWGEPISITRRADENFYFFSKGKIVKVSSVQGLVFSPNGRVYLTWYAHKKGGPWYNRIAVYDSLTGNFIDEKEFDFEGTYDEVEGLSLHPSGTLMVAVCDNDYVEVPCVDEFMVFAYKHKDDQFSV